MKTPIPAKNPSQFVLKTLKCVLASSVLLPSVARAVDWDGTTGLFGDPVNWDGDEVPSGVPAAITNGGNATVQAGDFFGVEGLQVGGHAGTGTITQTGGDVTATQIILGGDDGNGGTGVGNYTMSSGTLAGIGGMEMWVGSRGGTGTLTMSGDAGLTNNNWIIFGRDSGGTGNAVLSGMSTIEKTGNGNIALGVFTATTSTVTMSDTASMTSNNAIWIGWGNNSADTKGILNMSGGTITAGANIEVARREGGGSAAPSGELHMSGGAIANAGNEFYVGSVAGANGTLTMGDTSKINVTNGFVVGRFDSTGIATVGGNSEIAIGGFNVIGDGPPAVGTLIVNDNANVHSGRQLWLGLNNSQSTVTINGGIVQASDALDAGGNTDPTGAGVSFSRVSVTPGGGHGTINLNGGVLATPGFSKYDGTAQINLNGGTIRATGMTTTGSFFDNIGSAEINVQAGGAKFDTNGNSITVTQDLAGVGGLTKLGEGDLIFTGVTGYLGDTRIEDGTLSLSSASLADTANVYLTTGSFFDLSTNATDTINALFIDGVAQATGTWGAFGSGADHMSAFFSGDGLLNVTAIPEPSTVVLLIGGIGACLAVARRRHPSA